MCERFLTLGEIKRQQMEIRRIELKQKEKKKECIEEL